MAQYSPPRVRLGGNWSTWPQKTQRVRIRPQRSQQQKKCFGKFEKFEKDPYKYQGEVASGVWGDVKRSTDLTITDKENWKAEDNVFYKSLTPRIEEYVREFEMFYNISAVAKEFNDTGYQIQRTK